jgi:hypothetical protein
MVPALHRLTHRAKIHVPLRGVSKAAIDLEVARVRVEALIITLGFERCSSHQHKRYGGAVGSAQDRYDESCAALARLLGGKSLTLPTWAHAHALT